MSGQLSSNPADGGGALVQHGSAMGGGGVGLARASLPRSPRHGDVGFLGQNDVGVDGVLTRDETWRGMNPRWLAVAAPLLRA
jgi:hypothetical protein